MSTLAPSFLLTCPHCGLIQRLPPPNPHAADTGHMLRPHCARCRARLRLPTASTRSFAWPAALALAALILYPLAMSLPVLTLSKLGRTRDTTIWGGVVQLFADGHAIIGLIILVCSVVIPLAKILGIFLLCSPSLRPHLPRRHRALTYRAIDFLGRWGMIDVLLVAILVAAVKLGDWIDVHPGPGILAFAGVVILSLLSSLTFDPRSIWQDTPVGARALPGPPNPPRPIPNHPA